jgi:hypothetical protein
MRTSQSAQRGRTGLISGQLHRVMHDLKSRAVHGKTALHLEAPATSSYSDWLSAAIHCTDQDLLELRFVGFPPRDESRFSIAVRRRSDQWMLELRCDGLVEQMFGRVVGQSDARDHVAPTSASK